jgi:hypothetical protein
MARLSFLIPYTQKGGEADTRGRLARRERRGSGPRPAISEKISAYLGRKGIRQGGLHGKQTTVPCCCPYPQFVNAAYEK